VSASLPLAGLKVVEFSHMVMGPSAGLILGDMGADVVKVEPVGGGDNTRRLPGSGAGFFPTFNRNKRSLAVDLKSAAGLALVKRLVATADVVTENFRPGALDGLGLGYAALAEDHPRLVYCSMKGFLAGPYETRAALDEVVQMMGGLAYMTGPPGRPLRAGASVNDIMGGMFAVIGVLAALRQRDETGRGQHVKSALFENNVFLVAQHMAQYAVTGQAAKPMPTRLASWGIYDIFETADARQIFVGIVTDTQWRAFCAEFGVEDLAADPSLATNPQRVAARDRTIPRLRALFGGMAFDDVLAACDRCGLPYAPILAPHELFDDPQLAVPEAMVEITLADGAKARLPALPLEMDGARFGLRHDLPKLGANSREIAGELGYPAEEIDALVAAGVLQQA
jgi:crotonobetainyl-CoA:carnitine CoA-transferase CaiB-like acyl-CoA transferase